MAGIYGESLLAFPEQFRTVTVYSMTAQINAGWKKDPDSEYVIRGIYQHSAGKRVKDSNGNLVTSSGLELWTTTDGLNGMFTTLEGSVYRIVGDNNWDFEGGYYKYSMEKVVGNDGSESDNTTWNTGSGNFG